MSADGGCRRFCFRSSSGARITLARTQTRPCLMHLMTSHEAKARWSTLAVAVVLLPGICVSGASPIVRGLPQVWSRILQLRWHVIASNWPKVKLGSHGGMQDVKRDVGFSANERRMHRVCDGQMQASERADVWKYMRKTRTRWIQVQCATQASRGWRREIREKGCAITCSHYFTDRG